MAKRKDQYQIDIEQREAALKRFKSSFKQEHPEIAKAVKVFCNTPERDDEPALQHVASLMLKNRNCLTDSITYLGVMTSDCNLGRSKRYPAALTGEGENKMRGVLGILCGPA